MNISVPEFSLVVLIGASGSGKSTFARTHFKPTEIISSDFCRGLVSDDENDQAATKDAFEVLHYIAAKRLAAYKLTVIDATNVHPEARRPLIALAKEYHALPVAIVIDTPESLCQERNRARPDRDFGPHVIRNQSRQLHQSLRHLEREGFRQTYFLKSPEEVTEATLVRATMWTNRKSEHGPFDIIGDIHGCFDELILLLAKLGYHIEREPDGDAANAFRVSHPSGRKVVFLGDLVDRGPNIPDVLRLVMSMTATGTAFCVCGNHEAKLLKKLQGRQVQVTHGLAETLAQLEPEPEVFKAAVKKFIDGLVSHYVLDDGKLVVAHAGMKENFQGRASGKVRTFALYGETTGETDVYGLPVRYNWAAEYRGAATVVYGHTPVPQPEWLNRTVNVDTGCVFGGKLTALRYPEKELISEPAAKMYCEPAKPFQVETEASPLTAQQVYDDMLDIDDVIGKRFISTSLRSNITIREENAIAALEIMSRFAADPKWLIYLPPTMSPCEVSNDAGFLEHPAEAFAYYRNQGIVEVVCEEKHMGSRAVVVLCRDEAVAKRRFGITTNESGICYTRTGRCFFEDAALESELLLRLRTAMNRANVWENFKTDWICLDCELLPWSAKAQGLLREQYAPVGRAAAVGFDAATEQLKQAAANGKEVAALLEKVATRREQNQKYIDAYRRYCWPVDSIDDLKLAPFHILATEGEVHTGKTHLWQMETIRRICTADSGGGSQPSLLFATAYKTIDVTDESQVEAGIAWWLDLTLRGGEGMVVKPVNFVATNTSGLIQPAVKCRGREYLRIIYGAEYDTPENLKMLQKRSLGAKRSIALREFALGIESLERFVRREPLRKVHECVFGVLAMESEPVDPRL